MVRRPVTVYPQTLHSGLGIQCILYPTPISRAQVCRVHSPPELDLVDQWLATRNAVQPKVLIAGVRGSFVV